MPVWAILTDPGARGVADHAFEMLFTRFRENEERENVGAFEHLPSIGEMFERYESAPGGNKITTVAFADRVGVHEANSDFDPSDVINPCHERPAPRHQVVVMTVEPNSADNFLIKIRS